MQYLGTCLICEEEKIRSMLRQARPIPFHSARRAIGGDALQAWAKAQSGSDEVGPDIAEASYYRSSYTALPCIFLVNRRVRHIFI